jgi:hypothetical protein
MKIKKIQVKMILDIIMIVLMLLEFSAQFTGNIIHEIIGIILAVLFIIHNLLNYKWYTSLFKGKYNFNRVMTIIINLLLFISMIIVISSSIPISRTVFNFLSLNGNMSIRSIHTASAYWSLVFMAIHLGMHFNLISGIIKNKTTGKIIRLIKYIIEILIVLLGIKVFIQFNIWQQMTAYYTFGMWQEGTIINNLFNNCMLVFAIAIITHNLLKLRKIKK